MSGLTPLAEWNLSRNQKRGISELSMTLVTGAASPPLHTLGPCQYQGKTILGMSCKSVNVEKLGHTSGDGSYIIGIISHCRHCGLNKSNGIQWKVHHTFAFN